MILKSGRAALPLLLTLLATNSMAARPPNIVLMVGDDVGYSDLGSFGSEIQTPHLDVLAAQGMRFSNFHVTASCAPTRAILQTGVDHHRNGLGNMAITMPTEHRGQPGYEGVLNDRVVTMANLFLDAGYHTYHVGKWHLGFEDRKLPFYRGFERTITLADTGADNWEQRTYLPIYDKAHWFSHGKAHQLPDDFYSSKYFVDKAIEFIDADHGDDKPFFAQIGFQAVHIPLQAPNEFIEKYADAYAAGWEDLRERRRQRAVKLGLIPEDAGMVRMPSTEDWNKLDAGEQKYLAKRMAVYAGMLDAMDHHIGRLIAHLKKIGKYENTIFVFLSDNGAEPSDPEISLYVRLWIQLNYDTDLETLGEKGSYTFLGPSWASAAAAPGSFYKFYAGEGGLRVPLIISWPGRIQQGAIHRSLAHLKDVAPTLLELAGIRHPGTEYKGRPVEAVSGHSLVPVLTGSAAQVHDDDEAIGYELSGNAALFKGPHKLLRNLPPMGDGEWHLYDIMRDPGEAQDLKEAMPERFAELMEDYRSYEQANGVLQVPEGYEYTKQVLENMVEFNLKPKIRAAAPKILGGFLWLVALVYFYRRVRRKRATAG